MKRFNLIFAFLLILNSVQSQTDVFVAYSTSKADEPHLEESFILGYESFGNTWTGNIAYDTNVEVVDLITDIAPFVRSNGYDIITYSASVNYLSTGLEQFAFLFSEYYYDSIQMVDCGGSNAFRLHSNDNLLQNYISVGSGRTANATGYNVEFYTKDPFASVGTINWIMRGDTNYAISTIRRVTDSTMTISIAGITDITGYGFESQIPIRISGIAGTNISPLPPDSLYILTGANNQGSGRLLINFRTTAGTIGSEQSVTAGGLKTGTDNSYIMLKTSPAATGGDGTGISIWGVTGYSNNPNTEAEVISTGKATIFEIEFDLGDGKYSGGGYTEFNTQSYAHAYFAGLLSAVKDSLGCSWWEARYRLRMTASGGGNFDVYSGFGKPDAAAALSYSGSIPSDTYNTIGAIGELTASRVNNKVNLHIAPVENALSYQIFNNSNLLASISSTSYSTGNYTFTITPTSRKKPNRIWYQASRGQYQSADSPSLLIPYYYHYKIRIRP